MDNSGTFSTEGKDIAIIGMAGRFPGARNLDEYWQNLIKGAESITFFSDEELEASEVDRTILEDASYVKAGAILNDIEYFDASFFNYTPREAEIMDPQQRIFLEHAWEALENAGYSPENYRGLIGVYASAAWNGYLLHNLYSNQNHFDGISPFQVVILNDKDYLSTRVSYKLNLRGPSLTIQTACSSSLVAVHVACLSLLNYECDMALAGGVSINIPQKAGYFYQEENITSPDGHCRAFDARAQGTILGSGVGLVVLKRLTEALADGDYIYAVIKGSAINNDGALKVGYTAPSVDGQAEVIAAAQALAGVEPDTMNYIETHGTGTAMGDPIEIAALTKAFQAHTQRKGFCPIGSVKTNIGHANITAGLAGLIKTVLILKHKLIPPSLHFEEPNPQIDFENTPFYVNSTLIPLPAKASPYRAGVSSFGIGGTNVHVVLQEAPPIEPSNPSRPWQLLLLSARTSPALENATKNLAAHLKQYPHLNLADVAYTLQTGRAVFRHRRAIVCRNLSDAVTTLEMLDSGRVFSDTDVQKPRVRPVIFMFAGQGAQSMSMTEELYQLEASFREQVDYCAELLRPHLGLDLREVLYPDHNQLEIANELLSQTWLAQPALFVVGYALAQLWLRWGIRPWAVLGHSMGEYIAACLAGVFSLEEGLVLVALRGKLMQQLPAGAMLALPLSALQVQPFLDENLSLAAINGPARCVVSGSLEAVENLERQLVEKGVAHRRLQTSHAFHSMMMDPIIEPFVEQVKRIKLNPPQMPYLSNLTGTWINAAEATDPHYWGQQLRQTVRFSEGVEELLNNPESILLEVSPGPMLSPLVRQHPTKTKAQVLLSSLPHAQDGKSELAFLLNTLGRLWLAGVKIDWSGFYAHEKRQHVPLPTYPFERQRCWIDPFKQAAGLATPPQPALAKKQDVVDWFYIPSWKRSKPPILSELPHSTEQNSSCWLIFNDSYGLGSQLIERLNQAGQTVITVLIGQHFNQIEPHVYMLNPRQPADYKALFDELRQRDQTPHTIVHLWNVVPYDPERSGLKFYEEGQYLGFYSLLFLTQALDKENNPDPLRVSILSNGMQAVTGTEALCPEKATILGPCKVIPQEYPHLTYQSIDLTLPEPGTQYEERLIDQLLAELLTQPVDPIVAYRGAYRWLQTYEAIRLDNPDQYPHRLRREGVYLITGGLGGLGLVLAEYLARTVSAKLILTARSTFPPKTEWAQWLTTHEPHDPISRKIHQLQTMEEFGAEVWVVSADVADYVRMQAVMQQAYQRFGPIHGVIHAAGVAGGGLIQLKTKDMAARVLNAKVKGTLVLEALFKDIKLDFFVLYSSISSILGGFGQVDYCAANAFLDAFAHYDANHQGRFTVSINWDAWQEVGMTVNTTTSFQLRKIQERLLEKGILPAEGVEATRCILSTKMPQVVVATRDLPTLIEQANTLSGANFVEELEEVMPSKPSHPRPTLVSPYVAPRNETEQAMAEIWQRLLGIEQVGIHDNFFELGGDSLIGLQIVSQLKKTFNIEMSSISLYEGPTISAMAKILSQDQDDLSAFDKRYARGQRRRARKEHLRRKSRYQVDN